MPYKQTAISFIVIIQMLDAVFGCMKLFGYKEMGDDWPGTCSDGLKQSPIDIQDSKTVCKVLFFTNLL